MLLVLAFIATFFSFSTGSRDNAATFISDSASTRQTAAQDLPYAGTGQEATQPDNEQSLSTSAETPQPKGGNVSLSYASDRQGATIISSAEDSGTSTARNEEEAVPIPVTLKIASIKLTAPIIKTGLETDGSLHVPSSPDMTGWYKLGPKPGEIGPSVITGHLDSKAGPGILYNLKNVKAEDEIKVVRSDGSTAVFLVDKLEWYPQENFNTQAVYGTISTAGLRIITCAGMYDPKTRHYSDNLVVYATLSRIEIPGEYQPL